MSATNLPPDSEPTAAPPVVTPLQFSLRTLLILVTIIASIAGFFRWRHLHSPEFQEFLRQKQLVHFKSNFASVPLEVKDWEGSDVEIRKLVIDTLEAYGAVHRQYKNRKTGALINLIIYRGPGHASISHPRVGYGFDLLSGPRFRDYGLGQHVRSIGNWELKNNNDGKPNYELETFSARGAWSGSNSPRIDFKKEPEVTQMHMFYSAKTSAQSSWPEFDAFVVEIFPHLQENLFPGGKSSSLPDRPGPSAISQIPWVELFCMLCSVIGLIYLGRRRQSPPAFDDHDSLPVSEDLPLPSEP